MQVLIQLEFLLNFKAVSRHFHDFKILPFQCSLDEVQFRGEHKLHFWEKYVSQRSKKVPGFCFSKNVFQVTLLMNPVLPQKEQKSIILARLLLIELSSRDFVIRQQMLEFSSQQDNKSYRKCLRPRSEQHDFVRGTQTFYFHPLVKINQLRSKNFFCNFEFPLQLRV